MKRKICALLAAAIIFGMFAACGGSTSDVETTSSGSESSAVETAAPAETAAPVETAAADQEDSASEQLPTMNTEAGELEQVAMPLAQDNPTLSFWLPYPFFVGNMVEDMAQDVSVLAELQKRSGITFDITAINGEVEEEQFNLMIASGNYCDVITDMSKYSKGYDAAIEEGIILDLYDLVKNEAPNYWYYLNQDIDTLATLVTDDGQLPTIATLYKNSGSENAGYVIRQDWLDALNMETPQTYDEFASYIEASNEKYGAKGIYFNAEGIDNLFGFGFDCGEDYIVVDGTVQHSYTLDSFRSYLEMAADWYHRGLIYSDFYLYGNDDTEDQMFCRGELAANIGRCASYDMFYGYMDEGYEAVLAPMKPVRLNTGDDIHYSTTVGSLIKKEDTWSVTESCSKPELVMGLVNYLFSEEGQLLFNWGVEGEAYTLDAEGKPEYTDMMINDPDTPYLFTAFLYASNTASEYAPSVMDVSKQYYSFDDTAWAAYECYLDDGADGSYNYPDGATLSETELTEYATISGDLETYVDSQILAFITGQTVLDDSSWAEFQNTLSDFGVAKMVEMKQAAYDRYEEKIANLSE